MILHRLKKMNVDKFYILKVVYPTHVDSIAILCILQLVIFDLFDKLEKLNC